MSDAHEPACQLRARVGPGGLVRIVTRNLAYEAEGQLSLSPRAAHPSALDQLLGALATDVLAGFVREAAREGIVVHDAELRLAARLENPLVALGVVGEGGSPALAGVSGAFYVSADAAEPLLIELWRRALARAPVHATLVRCASVRIDLKPVS